MTDPIKDQALKGFNKLKIWVEASGRTLNEEGAVYDRQQSVGSKMPFEENFAFEISMDGRPSIHTVFLKNGNHSKERIGHCFAKDGNTLCRFAFYLDTLTGNAEAPVAPSTHLFGLGTINIKVYTVPILSAKGLSALSQLPDISVNVANLEPEAVCIRSRWASACSPKERKTNWGPVTPEYKYPGQEPIITCTYKLCRTGSMNTHFGNGMHGPGNHRQENIKVLEDQMVACIKRQDSLEKKQANDETRLNHLIAHAEKIGYTTHRPPKDDGEGEGSGGGGSSGRSGGSSSSASRGLIPDRSGSPLNEL